MGKMVVLENLNKDINKILNKLSKNDFDLDKNHLKISLVVNEDIIKEILKMEKTYVSKDHIEYIRLVCELLKALYDNTDLDYTFITDDLYDKAIIWLAKRNISVSGSLGVTRLLNTTKHKYPELKGTTNKAKYIWKKDICKDEKNVDTVEEFINRVYKKMGLKGKDEISINVSFKEDGSSIITDEYNGKIVQAITRGKNGLGADVTHVVKDIPSANIQFKDYTGVKNEIMLSKPNLDEYNKLTGNNYKNTRSAINSIMNNPEYAYLLTLVPLDYTDENLIRKERILNLNKIFSNQIDYYYKMFTGNKKEIMQFIEEFYEACMEIRPMLSFEIDGLVIEILDEDIREELGRRDDINEYEIALKFPSEILTTHIEDIKLEVGSTGSLTPVVYYEPVTFSNNTTHTKSSISSYGKFKEMELRKGDKVSIKYVNDVICQIFKDPEDKVNVNNKNPIIPFPKKCPLCDTKLTFTERMASCPNMACESRVIGTMSNFVNVMAITDIGDKTLLRLYECGIVNDIIELVNLKDKKREILKLEGFGEKSFMNMAIQIKTVMTSEVLDYLVLASIGIPTVRRRMFKTICEVLNIDEFIDIVKKSKNLDEFIDNFPIIKGVGEKSLEKIYEYLNSGNNMEVLLYLRNHMNILMYKDLNNDISMVIRMSGVRVPKDKMEELRSKGIDIEDSGVTKATNMLIIPDSNFKSTKVDKAKKYGAKIVTIDEFNEMNL